MKTILMMAITIDGKIAKYKDHPANWTSKADKKMFMQESKNIGVIIMGKTTYNTINRPLPNRLNIVLDFNPDISQNIPGLLEFTNKQPKDLLQELSQRNFNSVIIGGGTTINSLFLKENLIDELWLTIEPKIFGDGLSLFSGLNLDLNLELISVNNLDTNVIQVKYKVIK